MALVTIKDLKSTFFLYAINKIGENGVLFFLKYDDEVDLFQLRFVPPNVRTRVFYIDENLALSYRPDNSEIVGVQIESFAKAFLPKHRQLKSMWEKRLKGRDLGDVISISEKYEPQVAEKVAYIVNQQANFAESCCA